MTPQWRALGNDSYRFFGRLNTWMQRFAGWYREDVPDGGLGFPEYLTRLTLALVEHCRADWERRGDQVGLAVLNRRRIVVRTGRLDLGLFVLLDTLSARCSPTVLDEWQQPLRAAARLPANPSPGVTPAGGRLQ